MDNASASNANADATAVHASDDHDKSIRAITVSIFGLWNDFLAHLPQICACIVIVALTWSLARVASRVASSLLQHARLRTSLKDLFRQLIHHGVGTSLTLAYLIWPRLYVRRHAENGVSGSACR